MYCSVSVVYPAMHCSMVDTVMGETVSFLELFAVQGVSLFAVESVVNETAAVLNVHTWT